MPLDSTTFPVTEIVPAEPSLEGLIAWLEGQDPETVYDGGSHTDCLICRYIGTDSFVMAMRVVGGVDSPLHDVLASAAYQGKHTYGAALTRARALLEAS